MKVLCLTLPCISSTQQLLVLEYIHDTEFVSSPSSKPMRKANTLPYVFLKDKR